MRERREIAGLRAIAMWRLAVLVEVERQGGVATGEAVPRARRLTRSWWW
jgi:hypothetical protein